MNSTGKNFRAELKNDSAGVAQGEHRFTSVVLLLVASLPTQNNVRSEVKFISLFEDLWAYAQDNLFTLL
jgi:hypothetical protein